MKLATLSFRDAKKEVNCEVYYSARIHFFFGGEDGAEGGGRPIRVFG